MNAINDHMTKQIHAVREVVLSFTLFFAIFLPPLISISMTYITMVVMLAYIIISEFSRGYVTLRRGKGFKLLLLFVPFFVYVFFQVIINCVSAESSMEKSAYIYNITHIVTSSVYIVISYCFINMFVQKNRDINIVRCLITAGLIQTVLTFASLLSDSLHSTFLNLYFSNTKNEINSKLVTMDSWRAHGLTSYYFDSLAFILSGICLIAIVYALCSKRLRYYLIGIVILLAAVIGARTSIVLVLVGAILLFIYYAKQQNYYDIVKWIMVIIIVFTVLYFVFNSLGEGFRTWLATGWKTLLGLFSDSSNVGAFSEILDADITFPKDIIFGLGAKPEALHFFGKNGTHIDNGYIQLLWRFGVFGMILFIGGIVLFYINIYKGSKDKVCKGLSFVFLVTIGLYLFKYYPLSLYGAHIVYYVIPAVLYNLNDEEGGQLLT